MIGRTFGGFNTQDPINGITTTRSTILSPATNNIQADTLAEADGARVVKQQRSSKTWNDTIILRATSREALEQKFDAFNVAMGRKNQAYDLEYAGGIRRYLANVRNIGVNDEDGLTRIICNVEFLCADGVGWSLETEDFLVPTPFTTSTASWQQNIVGSYDMEPLISIAFGTVSGATGKTVTITNGETLRGIAVTRDWTAGDLLEIDSLRKEVRVNNQIVDFAGGFPRWEAGTGTVSYLDDFSARNATAAISYTPRWL